MADWTAVYDDDRLRQAWRKETIDTDYCGEWNSCNRRRATAGARRVGLGLTSSFGLNVSSRHNATIQSRTRADSQGTPTRTSLVPNLPRPPRPRRARSRRVQKNSGGIGERKGDYEGCAGMGGMSAPLSMRGCLLIMQVGKSAYNTKRYTPSTIVVL
jgi:hypothetical protein